MGGGRLASRERRPVPLPHRADRQRRSAAPPTAWVPQRRLRPGVMAHVNQTYGPCSKLNSRELLRSLARTLATLEEGLALLLARATGWGVAATGR
jgi:hypothetical protein